MAKNMAKKSCLKTIGSRVEPELNERIEAVVEALSEKLGTRLLRSNVVQICITNHLPVLEKEHGIKG